MRRVAGGRYPLLLIGLTIGLFAGGAGITVYAAVLGKLEIAAVFFLLTIGAAFIPRALRARFAVDAMNRTAEASLEAESAKLEDPQKGVSEQRGPAREHERR